MDGVDNIDNNQPVELKFFIECNEKALAKKAITNSLPVQSSGVSWTYADVVALVANAAFQAETQIEVGIQRLVDWCEDLCKVK